VANSEHTARRFRQANPGFSGRPIAVCHLGVGAADAARSPMISARDVAGPFALIVGRLAGSERYKGHDVLIDLWPRIRDAVPDARLVVAGDGDDRARLEAKAAALGPPVRFLGRVSDQALDALYRDCAFFVMPSRDEGFGLVFLEAMRAGKACIGGAGAAAEVIEDGVTGLVVDATDEGEIEKAVVRLFLEPETRARMGGAGAERVAREFTEAHFRRRFRAILGLHTP
jgi:phosphatidylinositol alpha-1,6-mannosyltransferase